MDEKQILREWEETCCDINIFPISLQTFLSASTIFTTIVILIATKTPHLHMYTPGLLVVEKCPYKNLCLTDRDTLFLFKNIRRLETNRKSIVYPNVCNRLIKMVGLLYISLPRISIPRANQLKINYVIGFPRVINNISKCLCIKLICDTAREISINY